MIRDCRKIKKTDIRSFARYLESQAVRISGKVDVIKRVMFSNEISFFAYDCLSEEYVSRVRNNNILPVEVLGNVVNKLIVKSDNFGLEKKFSAVMDEMEHTVLINSKEPNDYFTLIIERLHPVVLNTISFIKQVDDCISSLKRNVRNNPEVKKSVYYVNESVWKFFDALLLQFPGYDFDPECRMSPTK